MIFSLRMLVAGVVDGSVVNAGDVVEVEQVLATLLLNAKQAAPIANEIDAAMLPDAENAALPKTKK